MKIDELIKNLANEHKPTRVFRVNFILFFKLVFAAIFTVAAAVAIIGLRFDMLDKVKDISFWLESLVIFILAIMSSASALILSVPRQEVKSILFLPLVTLLLWILILGFTFITYPYLPAGWGFACIADIVFMSIIPAAFIFYFIRKAAPLKRDWVGFLAMLSAASYGAFGTQMICYISSPLHLLMWHLLPTIAISILGIYIGRKFLPKI